MIVHLRAVMDVASVLGGKEHVLDLPDGVALGGLVELLISRYGGRLGALLLTEGAQMELLPHMRIYVNGRGPEFLQGFDTILQDGDDVMIMPRLSGG